MQRGLEETAYNNLLCFDSNYTYNIILCDVTYWDPPTQYQEPSIELNIVLEIYRPSLCSNWPFMSRLDPGMLRMPSHLSGSTSTQIFSTDFYSLVML